MSDDEQHTHGSTWNESEDRWYHHFSQSMVNTYFHCPEQLRLDMAGELTRRETDATAVGTSMHAGIEHVLGGATADEGKDAAIAKWRELEAEGISMIQVVRPSTAERYVATCFDAWYAEVYPRIPGAVAIEQKFDVLLHEDDERVIRIKGAWDLVDELFDVWDWKTSNQPYEQWQVDRHKIQPTFYTYGAHKVFGVDAPVEFHYSVCQKGAQPRAEVLSTERGHADWAWLAELCESLAVLVEAQLPVWPKNSSDWWCSAKWCTAFAEGRCRGAHQLQLTAGA